MESAKLSYAGIAGAVAGVLGLFGAVSKWYAVSLAGGTVTIKGTSDASGKLALAMSVALFAFSAAYVLIADARMRRSMAALMIVTAVVLTLAAVWGLTRADGASVEMGLWLTGLAGVLGIGAGVLTLKEAPVDEDIVEPEPVNAEAAS